MSIDAYFDGKKVTERWVYMILGTGTSVANTFPRSYCNSYNRRIVKNP